MTDKLRDDFSATASKEVASIMASGPYGYVGYTMIDAIIRREITRARAEALEEAAKVARVAWLKSKRQVVGDADREDALCEEIAAAILALK